MAVQEQVQNQGRIAEDIILVSPLLINGNVTMSHK
jgi:hypothetical protein